MALARVVSFENVSKDRIEELKREMASESGPPEGIPSTELLVLHDADAEKSLVVVFFDTEDDYAKGDARLRKLTLEKKIPAALRDEAYYQLAISNVMQGMNEDAMRTIRQLTAVSKAGEAVENARFLLGQILMQQGNLPAAADEFRNFKKAFPASPHMKTIDRMLPEIERRLSVTSK